MATCLPTPVSTDYGARLIVGQEQVYGVTPASGRDVRLHAEDFVPTQNRPTEASGVRSTGGAVQAIAQMTTQGVQFTVPADASDNMTQLLEAAFSMADDSAGVVDLLTSSVATAAGVSTITTATDVTATVAVGDIVAFSGTPTGSLLPVVVTAITPTTISTTSEFTDLGTDAGPTTYKIWRPAQWRKGGGCSQSISVECVGNKTSQTITGGRIDSLTLAADATSSPQIATAAISVVGLRRDDDAVTPQPTAPDGRVMTGNASIIEAPIYVVNRAAGDPASGEAGVSSLVAHGIRYPFGADLATELAFQSMSFEFSFPVDTVQGATPDRAPVVITHAHDATMVPWTLSVASNDAARPLANAFAAADVGNLMLTLWDGTGYMVAYVPSTQYETGNDAMNGGTLNIPLSGNAAKEPRVGGLAAVTLAFFPDIAAAMA